MPPPDSPSSTQSTDAAAFSAILKAEQNSLAAFVGLLEVEQEALIRGDADGLAVLTNEKANKIDLLDRLSTQRRHYLAVQNLTASAEGMAIWLSCNPGFSATVSKVWRELLTLSETAWQINQNIGILIESRLQQNRLKLATLQSAVAPDRVYCPDGQLSTLSNTRPLRQV